MAEMNYPAAETAGRHKQSSDILTSDEHNFIEAPTSRPYNC
jgi:hypothetical protein